MTFVNSNDNYDHGEHNNDLFFVFERFPRRSFDECKKKYGRTGRDENRE